MNTFWMIVAHLVGWSALVVVVKVALPGNDDLSRSLRDAVYFLGGAFGIAIFLRSRIRAKRARFERGL